MNVLLTSAGRRVALLQCFRSAFAGLGTTGKIIAADASPDAPALQFADEACILPRCTEDGFIPALLALCETQAIDAIVPTIDTELPILAAHRAELEDTGAALWLSSAQTIEIAGDKRNTNRWLRAQGLPTVSQYDLSEAHASWRESDGPLIAKPVRGSASVGVRRLTTRLELDALGGEDYVVETVAAGVEYTVHVWAGAGGQALCAVPCRRLEVRAGEVSKGQTVKHRGLMQLAQQVVEALPGCRGPLNVQIFLDAAAGMRVIEINPRFGGGYPLVDRAGAPFARWIIDRSDRLRTDYFDGWVDELIMLRYDAAVFLSKGDVVPTRLSATSPHGTGRT